MSQTDHLYAAYRSAASTVRIYGGFRLVGCVTNPAAFSVSAHNLSRLRQQASQVVACVFVRFICFVSFVRSADFTRFAQCRTLITIQRAALLRISRVAGDADSVAQYVKRE